MSTITKIFRYALPKDKPCQRRATPARFAAVSQDKKDLNRIRNQYDRFTAGYKDPELDFDLSRLEFDIFTDPYKCLSSHRENPFSLIVYDVDCGPRRMGGWDAVRLLLRAPNSRNVVFLIATTKSDVANEVESVIKKPFTFDNIYTLWKKFRRNPFENHFELSFRAAEYFQGKIAYE